MNDINQQLAAIGDEIREDQQQPEEEQHPEEQQPEEKQPEEEALPTSVSSLAEAIGWSPEELYDIDVSMGDGKDPIKLGALKDQYETAVAEKATATAEVDRLRSEATNAPNTAVASQELLQAQANVISIQQQYQNYDWAAAELNDPGQAALLRQKFTESFAHANGQVSRVQQQQQQQRQQQLAQGEVRLIELIPEWKNNETRQAAQTNIKALMSEAGYPTEFINGVDDPIAIALLNELAILRAEKSAAGVAVTKVRKAPRVLKSSGKLKPTSQEKQTELANKARATGDRNDQVAAVKALFN